MGNSHCTFVLLRHVYHAEVTTFSRYDADVSM